MNEGPLGYLREKCNGKCRRCRLDEVNLTKFNELRWEAECMSRANAAIGRVADHCSSAAIAILPSSGCSAKRNQRDSLATCIVDEAKLQF